MRIVTDEKDRQAYKEFLEKHERCNFQQSPEWAKVKGNWINEIVLAEDESGKIIGAVSILIRKIPIFGNIMYSSRGPTCDIHDISVMKQLTDGIKELAKKYKAIVYKAEPDILSSDEEYRKIVTSLGYKIKDDAKNFREEIQPRYVFRLDIKGKTEELLFVNSNCERLKDDVKIIHKAIYIDNPFVVDELSRYRDSGNPMNDMLIGLLTAKERDNVMDGIVESVRAKEKLNDIYRTLQNVIEGEILFNQSNEEYYLKNKKFSEPISFHNLSTGMKSFVILKMLLERGCLKEKDVVILDEPEIHLHPQWQIAYAELLVLLQKQFDLSVVVTTHSPYFVDAINLFSCKYATDSSVNYYISSVDNNRVNMKNVTDNIEEIYKKMVSPIEALDTLRYELNNG